MGCGVWGGVGGGGGVEGCISMTQDVDWAPHYSLCTHEIAGNQFVYITDFTFEIRERLVIAITREHLLEQSLISAAERAHSKS